MVEFAAASLLLAFAGAYPQRHDLGSEGIFTGLAPVILLTLLGEALLLGWAGPLAWRRDGRWWRSTVVPVALVPAAYIVILIVLEETLS